MTKKLDPRNWLEQDATLNTWLPSGAAEPISQQAWAEALLKPQSDPAVPADVQRLYEGARAALVYGYFYFGLCFMGMVALYRVAETALVRRCQIAGLTADDFDTALAALAGQHIVQTADWSQIADARSGRFLPQEVAPMLEHVTAQINTLFSHREI